jgi:hypothetical protein
VGGGEVRANTTSFRPGQEEGRNLAYVMKDQIEFISTELLKE